MTIIIVLASNGQKADGYDTLNLRGDKQILVPRYDTIKQLKEANATADSLLYDLSLIKKQLGIKDSLR